MSAGMRHWAAPYIHRPWQLGAEGPAAYDCWGLVRAVQREHFGRELPPLDAGLQAITAGWQPGVSPGRGDGGDIVEMRSARGPHVGVLIVADGRDGVLHAVGHRDADGRDHGDVCFTPIEQLGALGLGRLRFWRPV